MQLETAITLSPRLMIDVYKRQELTRIQNAFMRHQPLVAGVENREEMSEFLGNVVGVKDGHFRGFPEACLLYTSRCV